MEVIKISPRGYCYGVVDALQIARQAAKDATLPRPIYVIGQIIHNRHAIDELTKMGIVTLDGPDRATILEQVSRRDGHLYSSRRLARGQTPGAGTRHALY